MSDVEVPVLIVGGGRQSLKGIARRLLPDPASNRGRGRDGMNQLAQQRNDGDMKLPQPLHTAEVNR
jgi:hypothetical protein